MGPVPHGKVVYTALCFHMWRARDILEGDVRPPWLRQPGEREGGEAMSFVLGLAQVAHPADGDVATLVRGYVDRAAGQGCSLVAFPESLMGPWDEATQSYRHAPEPLDGPFCCQMDRIAREYGIWLVYTTEEANPHDAQRPYNTAVVTDAQGVRRASYRKAHLYDALGVRESDRMTAGSRPPAVVETPFCRLGVGICYDLRFPEFARGLALAGAELLLFPAAWVSGPHKVRQWRTLLSARAIENECFVAGIGRVGDGRSGNSLVANPLGITLAHAGDEECLLTCEIDLAEIAAARRAMPILSHRRPELYEC